MDIRKSAVDLTDAERDAFLRALFTLKHRAAGPGATFSVYDQFVALHQAVMALLTAPGEPDPVNVGHWNMGFAAWHREYLRRFELALQSAVPGVTVPYWDWAAHARARTRLFADAFLGQTPGGAAPVRITSGFLVHTMPSAGRPAWWPVEAGGWRIHPALQELRYPPGTPNVAVLNATLHRGGSAGIGWPPAPSAITALTRLHPATTGASHHFWWFAQALEEAPRMHNTAHNWIGGHMGGGASPNDPIFWLHHANVDRLWELWQQFHEQPPHGGPRDTHYPPTGQVAPWNGRLAPTGHYLDDLIWPWVGATPGYSSGADAAIRAMLIDYSGEPARRLRDVLDPAAIFGGYRYQPPAA